MFLCYLFIIPPPCFMVSHQSTPKYFEVLLILQLTTLSLIKIFLSICYNLNSYYYLKSKRNNLFKLYQSLTFQTAHYTIEFWIKNDFSNIRPSKYALFQCSFRPTRNIWIKYIQVPCFNKYLSIHFINQRLIWISGNITYSDLTILYLIFVVK